MSIGLCDSIFARLSAKVLACELETVNTKMADTMGTSFSDANVIEDLP
jgi:hypothetical protein